MDIKHKRSGILVLQCDFLGFILTLLDIPDHVKGNMQEGTADEESITELGDQRQKIFSTEWPTDAVV
jgi:hypothetical protein